MIIAHLMALCFAIRYGGLRPIASKKKKNQKLDYGLKLALGSMWRIHGHYLSGPSVRVELSDTIKSWWESQKDSSSVTAMPWDINYKRRIWWWGIRSRSDRLFKTICRDHGNARKISVMTSRNNILDHSLLTTLKSRKSQKAVFRFFPFQFIILANIFVINALSIFRTM